MGCYGLSVEMEQEELVICYFTKVGDECDSVCMNFVDCCILEWDVDSEALWQASWLGRIENVVMVVCADFT